MQELYQEARTGNVYAMAAVVSHAIAINRDSRYDETATSFGWLLRSQAQQAPSDSAGPLNQQNPFGQGFKNALAFLCTRHGRTLVGARQSRIRRISVFRMHAACRGRLWKFDAGSVRPDRFDIELPGSAIRSL